MGVLSPAVVSAGFVPFCVSFVAAVEFTVPDVPLRVGKQFDVFVVLVGVVVVVVGCVVVLLVVVVLFGGFDGVVCAFAGAASAPIKATAAASPKSRFMPRLLP